MKKVVSIAVLIALFSFLLIMLLPAAASAQPAPAPRSWNQVFELNKNQPDTSWQFSYVQFTDLHIGEGFNDYGTPGFDDQPPAGDVGSSAENLRQAVNLVNAEREQYRIKFVIVTGDMSGSGERSELLKCKEILDSLEVPYIPTIGNHDIWPYREDANGTPINSQTPCGDQYYRDVFGSYLDHLRDSGYFYNWDDGTRNTPIWNGEADTLAGPNTGCYSYFDNYAFDYAGYHFIASDFNTRDRALLWWGGSMPAADLYDSDLCRGTWPWYKNHYNNYPYKAADNMLTFLHQPLCTSFFLTWFTFDPIEYNTVTDFIHDNYYKDYTGLWAGGHFHVDTSPFFSPPFEYDIANRAGDYICPGVHTPAIKDDPNNFRIFKVWGKTARPKPTGVILYENENFSGRGEFFPAQDPDLSNNLIGANSASSLRIVGSGTVDLYRNTNYRGERLELTKDVPRLSAYGFGNAALSVAFNVPGVSGISPRYGATGTIARINDLSGARFEDGASVCLEKQGQESIRGDSVHVVNPEMITCTFNLNRAALGQWDVVVTNPEGQTGILRNGFEVKQVPQINSVSPVSGTANSVVTINGVGFDSAQGNSRVYFGDKPASSIQSWSDTRIDVRVPNDSHGISNIKVQTDWGTSNTMSFTVTNPLVKSISPGSARPGQTLDVSITGADTNFKNGVSKASFSWKGISVNSMVVRDATHAKANITIARNAPVGPREVNVITGSEVPTALAGGFTVRKFELPPSPSTNSTWYLAEGTSAWGFTTYITIENPNNQSLHAKLTYMNPSPETGKGRIAERTVTLVPMSQTTVDPRWDLGNTDFSTKVECSEGKKIAVDRTMSWTGQGAPCPEAHSSVGVNSPSKTWYLPEGSSKWGFETWTLVQNPNDHEASVTLTYMIEGQGPKTLQKTIPAYSRATYSMASDIGLADSSIKVSSSLPVVAERSQYRNNRREGSCSIGATTPSYDYFLSEGSSAWGFTTYILIQNPNDSEANVSLTYMTTGGPMPMEPFTMSANSRKTIDVNDIPSMKNKDFTTQLLSDKPIIAERSMYWGAGTPLGEACHDSIGLDSPHMSFYLPDGQNSDGWETYTLVENPNPGAVRVLITYLTPTGKGNVSFKDEIPPNSRRTYSMAGNKTYPGITGRASIMVNSLDGARPIIVERSMYCFDRGLGTASIGAFED